VFSVTRLRNPIPVFTQDNDRIGDLCGLAKDRFKPRFPLRHRGKSIRMQNHNWSSAPICSNSSSMIRLILAFSLRSCRSLPKAAIHGLPLPLSARIVFCQRLGDKCLQRNPAFGGHRLGAAEDRVGNFKRCFHILMLPYLRSTSISALCESGSPKWLQLDRDRINTECSTLCSHSVPSGNDASGPHSPFHRRFRLDSYQAETGESCAIETIVERKQ
jgi:hypothetical protein